MDLSFTSYLTLIGKLIFYVASLALIGGMVLIVKAYFTLRTSSSEEDTKTICLSNLKVGSAAIIIALIAIAYLRSFLTVSVNYI